MVSSGCRCGNGDRNQRDRRTSLQPSPHAGKPWRRQTVIERKTKSQDVLSVNH